MERRITMERRTSSMIAVSAALCLSLTAAIAAEPIAADKADTTSQVFSADGPLFADPELASTIEPASSETSGPGLNAATQGCNSGYVCVYPQNAGWNGGHPSLTYFRYGCYNFSNQVGYHYVFNNQTNAALAQLWTGYNCTGTKSYIFLAGASANVFMTPINSISLSP